MARDIRQAGNMPCGNDIEIVNILNGAQGNSAAWQYDWGQGILGLTANDGLNGISNRVAGTEALILTSGDAGGVYLIEDKYPAANIVVGAPSGSHGIVDGDILLVCNHMQGTIFQVSANPGNGGGNGGGSGNNNEHVININTGNGTPGNCTKGLGPLILDGDGKCDNNGSPGPYTRNATIGKLASVVWYIGDNDRNAEGGRSLYMARLTPNSSGNAVLNEVEIASGVVDLELLYRRQDTSDFVGAASISDWGAVNAVQVSLKLDSQEQNVSIDSSNNSGRISRELTSIVAIRNRSL